MPFAAGISALYFNLGRGAGLLHPYTPVLWHELVAVTAGCGIRLRLSGRPFALINMLMPPSWTGGMAEPPARTELVQRLTALSISVAWPAEIAVVCSLAALRHLQMDCPADADYQLLGCVDTSYAASQWQLGSLRTLQLSRMPPASLFTLGAAACLPQLHSLRLFRCCLRFSSLPSELLKLPALSRLELLQLPVLTMPDLRGLPALRMLLVCGRNGRPSLDASQARCSAELKAALMGNPLGAASGLNRGSSSRSCNPYTGVRKGCRPAAEPEGAGSGLSGQP